MSEWKDTTLGDILQFQRGFDITKKEQKTGNIPVVSSSGIASYHNEAKAKAPGVVIGRKGTLGTVHYINTDYWAHDTTLWVKDFKGNLPKFIYYFLKVMHLENYDTGASNPTLNRNHIHKIRLKFPPFPIQKKIAEVLSVYDDLIENNDRRITLLEKMAEEIYREWFVRLRFPGHEQVTFHKGIPEGWKVARIEALCREVRNGVKVKNLDRNTKYLGLEHLPRKSILINDFDTVDSVQSDKLLFKERDILFSKIRPYLHKIVLANFAGACSSDTIVIRPREIACEGFLLFTIFSDTFVELATISSKGTKMPRADWDFLKRLEITLPDQQILESYQKKFDSYFALMCRTSAANEILKQTRDRLLTRLISGKLSVEDLDIQFPPSMTADP